MRGRKVLHRRGGIDGEYMSEEQTRPRGDGGCQERDEKISRELGGGLREGKIGVS